MKFFGNIMKLVVTITSVLVFSLLFFLSPAHAASPTLIVDDITTDTTWSLADSPYIVENDITVWSGATLTIEPGVIVKFKNGTSMDVWGSLSAEGTGSDHVFFTSLLDDSVGGDTNGDGSATSPSAGNWKGIYFDSAEGVSLKNCDISFSNNGFYFGSTNASISDITGHDNYLNDLWADGGSAVTLSGGNFSNTHYYSVLVYDSALVADHLTIDGTQNYAAIQTSNSDLTLADSSIQNMKIVQTEAIAAEGPGTINLERTTFKNANDVVGYEGIILNIKDSTLDNSYMLTWGGATSNLDNTILENSRGIVDFGDSIYNINKSQIINNDNGIYVWRDTSAPDSVYNISDSTISGNAYYGVYNRAAYPINFRNVWWGDASGPQHPDLNPAGLGNAVSDNVLFQPWLISDPFEKSCATDCFSNVLFLPGLEASRLYEDTTPVLGCQDPSGICEEQRWETNGNSDVEALYLHPDGTSIKPDIYTRDIIKETNTPFPMGSAGQNIYKSFSNKMDQLVSDQKIKEWKPFAYDWRQDVEDIVNNGTKYKGETVSLIDTLQSLVDSSKNGKVTIVAHSNGGLVAKALLKKLEDDKTAGKNNLIDKVDVLILVAVPEIGTAKAVPAILHGYDQDIMGGWLQDETHARELGRNMLGAYGLLPSKEYINHVSASPTTFVDNAIPSNITTKMVQTFGSAISSYSEYKDFLFGAEGRTDPLIGETKLPISLSQNLFSQAETLHDSIDAWTPPASMRVIEVAGWGLDTVASFEYYPRQDCSNPVVGCVFVLDERPRFTADGDGTVVVPSAQYENFLGNAEKYWLNLFNSNKDRLFLATKNNHGNILEVSSILNFISNTIQKLPLDNSPFISIVTPIDTSNRFRISIHSPATLDAYIGSSHTGKICPPTSDFCYLEETIPNSSYIEFGEGKYLSLPEDGSKNIKLSGTGAGTFTFNLDEFQGDMLVASATFKGIPVTPNTKVNIDLQNDINTLSPLHIDIDGDGTVDFNLPPKINGVATMPYIFSGFLQPINDTSHLVGQNLSVFKAGSTIPVKFQLKKYDGTVVQANSTPLWLAPQKGSAMSASVDESVYSTSATNGNTYNWDPASQQYTYNWSTKGLKAGYWYKISAKLDDGNVYSVTVGLK